jgi:hypothetical protein
MKHATNCKFCKIPISVSIDDSYAELRDPFKLIQIAACNRCADLRITKRKLEGKIKIVVMGYALSSAKEAREIELKIREVLTDYTKQYAHLIAVWHKRDGMLWDEEVVNSLIDRPKYWGDSLKRLWTMFKDAYPQQ